VLYPRRLDFTSLDAYCEAGDREAKGVDDLERGTKVIKYREKKITWD
jgi:hypothetical protein